jgi:hypothetical protein
MPLPDHIQARIQSTSYQDIEYIRSLIDLERDWVCAAKEKQGIGDGVGGETTLESQAVSAPCNFVELP